MRKITEALRLHHQHQRTHREIARAIGSSPTTVSHYLRRAHQAGIGYPLPEGLDDAAIEALLFPPVIPANVIRSVPDWASVHRELRNKSVTLDLLWQEYKADHPNGYRYSWFCKHYQQWLAQLPVSMRQTHTPGEKLFVDYAGQTLPIYDGVTGKIRQAQLFIAVLGASNYTYAELTWTQKLPDWIGSHVRAFEFLGGTTEVLVPDNLKSGVKHASYYDPQLNPTYQDFAQHYQVAVLPARPYKPKDKAKVEGGVLIAERWILARLRHQRFFSLAEANCAVAELLKSLNHRPFKKLPGCRHSAFLEMDAPALNPLPLCRYEYAEWKTIRAGVDYHVEGDGHYYSVPHHLTKKKMEMRLTATTVEIFHRGQRVAAHVRSSLKGRHSTIASHMPPAHQAVASWDESRLFEWGQRIGPHTQATVQVLLRARKHPQQNYRACLGVLRLATSFGNERLEAACARAQRLNATSYRSIHSILKSGLDRQTSTLDTSTPLPLEHANVRGPEYYH